MATKGSACRSGKRDAVEHGGGGGGGGWGSDRGTSSTASHASSRSPLSTAPSSRAAATSSLLSESDGRRADTEGKGRVADPRAPATREAKSAVETTHDMDETSPSLLQICLGACQRVLDWLTSATCPREGFTRVLGPRSVTAYPLDGDRVVLIFGEDYEKEIPELREPVRPEEVATFVEFAENLAREHPGRTFRIFMEARYPDGCAPIDFRVRSEEVYDSKTIGKEWEGCMNKEAGRLHHRAKPCLAPESLHIQATDIKMSTTFDRLTTATAKVIHAHRTRGELALSSLSPADVDRYVQHGIKNIQEAAADVTAESKGRLWDAVDKSAGLSAGIGTVPNIKWKARLEEERASLEARFDALDAILVRSDTIRSEDDLHAKVALPLYVALDHAHSLFVEMQMALSKEDVLLSYGGERHARHQRAFLHDMGYRPVTELCDRTSSTSVDVASGRLPFSRRVEKSPEKAPVLAPACDRFVAATAAPASAASTRDVTAADIVLAPRLPFMYRACD
jgi:hypothetical protein